LSWSRLALMLYVQTERQKCDCGRIIKTMNATVARTVISSFFLPRIQ
jgi:hypothetical protein